MAYKKGLFPRPGSVVERDAPPLVRPHSATLGDAGAPVVIVEFFDPACETCAAFYPFVKRLMAEHPNKIRLVLRNAPLHEGAITVAALLEAARLQGKYWPALEALLATQHVWAPHHTARADLAWNQLGGLGLDTRRLRADLESQAVADLLAQDIEDARILNVTKTPEFFVNGRRLPVFGRDPLKKLVEDALRE